MRCKRFPPGEWLPARCVAALADFDPSYMFYGVACHYEDRKTKSDVQKSIIGQYFYYQASHRSLTLKVILFSANLIYLRTHTLSLPISSSLLQRAQFWIL